VARGPLAEPKDKVMSVIERSIPVEVIRPERTGRDGVVSFVVAALQLLISSAFAMLLLGASHHEIDAHVPALGYAQTLLGLYTLKTIVGAVTPWESYKLWSRERRKG
jgi:hypothetical protein